MGAWSRVHATLGESGIKPKQNPIMNRQIVTSSNLYAVGYDESSGTLQVEFRNGSIYEYYNVPASVYQGLLDAPSKGRYFYAHIRNTYQDHQLI